MHKRVIRHARFGMVSAALVGTVFLGISSDYARFRLSMAFAYASLALLVWVLALGPLNVLRGQRNPVSTNLRRDLGFWAGGLGLLHVVVGLQVHLHGKMPQYFLRAPEPGRIPLPRIDAFGLANDLGLAAALVLALLIGVSNDASLRRLGLRRWKQLQRSNYVGMALIAIHGLLYQIIEKRIWPLVLIYVWLLAAAAAIQYAGYRAHRQRQQLRQPGGTSNGDEGEPFSPGDTMRRATGRSAGERQRE